jgi:hypothetical protein
MRGTDFVTLSAWGVVASRPEVLEVKPAQTAPLPRARGVRWWIRALAVRLAARVK